MGKDLEYKGGTTEKDGRVEEGGGSAVRNHDTGKQNRGKVNRCEVVCVRLLCVSSQVREEIKRGQALHYWTGRLPSSVYQDCGIQ